MMFDKFFDRKAKLAICAVTICLLFSQKGIGQSLNSVANNLYGLKKRGDIREYSLDVIQHRDAVIYDKRVQEDELQQQFDKKTLRKDDLLDQLDQITLFNDSLIRQVDEMEKENTTSESINTLLRDSMEGINEQNRILSKDITLLKDQIEAKNKELRSLDSLLNGIQPSHATLSSSTSTNTAVFVYTGRKQSWVVPEGVTKITVKLWGAGGGFGIGGKEDGTGGKGGNGGGGGYAKGEIVCQPGDVFDIEVGGAGGFDGMTFGSGGSGSGYMYDNRKEGGHSGAGGGHSSISKSYVHLITAAGGGGGGGACCQDDIYGGNGGAGGGASGVDGQHGNGERIGHPGRSGLQVLGFADPVMGLGHHGGNGQNFSVDDYFANGGGGGSGHFGGEGGGASSAYDGGVTMSGGGGGGGSSYIGGSENGITIAGNGHLPGNWNDPQRGKAGEGGLYPNKAQNGLVIISW